jgi:hypothetical protein
MIKGKVFKYCPLRVGFLKFIKLHDRLNSFQSYTLHKINLLEVLLWSEEGHISFSLTQSSLLLVSEISARISSDNINR